MLAPEQPLDSRETYQDVDQDQLCWIPALLVEHLLHAGLRGIGLKPTAVAVQAVMNLQETFGDLSRGMCLGWGGPAVSCSPTEENKTFLGILRRCAMEKLHTLVSERNGSTHAKPFWRKEGDDKGDGDRFF